MKTSTPRWTFLTAICLLVGGCDGDQKEAPQPTQPAEAMYALQCDLELSSTAQPPTIRVEATGTDFDSGSAAIWEAACAQLGLEPGCRDTHGEFFRGTPSCSQMTVIATETVQAAAGEEGQWSCRMTLEDRRELRPIVLQAREVRPSSDSDLDEFCQQALIAACSVAGVEGDCTAGDDAAYTITSTAASRNRERRQ